MNVETLCVDNETVEEHKPVQRVSKCVKPLINLPHTLTFIVNFTSLIGIKTHPEDLNMQNKFCVLLKIQF
ncbi:hypothetical protein MHYP_G00054280 [Metynnis hypsauchen]